MVKVWLQLSQLCTLALQLFCLFFVLHFKILHPCLQSNNLGFFFSILASFSLISPSFSFSLSTATPASCMKALMNALVSWYQACRCPIYVFSEDKPELLWVCIVFLLPSAKHTCRSSNSENLSVGCHAIKIYNMHSSNSSLARIALLYLLCLTGLVLTADKSSNSTGCISAVPCLAPLIYIPLALGWQPSISTMTLDPVGALTGVLRREAWESLVGGRLDVRLQDHKWEWESHSEGDLGIVVVGRLEQKFWVDVIKASSCQPNISTVHHFLNFIPIIDLPFFALQVLLWILYRLDCLPPALSLSLLGYC